MTYDLEVIFKYCGGSSWTLILGCPWRWYWSLRWRSWGCLGASVGGLGRSWEPMCGQERPKSSQERPKSAPKSGQDLGGVLGPK